MPPKKKPKDTRVNTEVFLLGQPSDTPATVTKPLTNGDMLRYLHWRKGLDANKSADWETLFSCTLKSGTIEASCNLTGCFSKGDGNDICGVSFSKHTGGWLKTGLPLMSDQAVKNKVKGLFKGWQTMNKMRTRLSKPNLSASQTDLVQNFQKKMTETFLITDTNAEELINKDKMRNKQQKEEDLAFLKSMKEDRIATVSSKDKVYQETVDSKMKRLEDENRRKEEYKKSKESINQVVVEPGDLLVSDDDTTDEDFAEVIKRKKKEKTVKIEVPKTLFSFLLLLPIDMMSPVLHCPPSFSRL